MSNLTQLIELIDRYKVREIDFNLTKGSSEGFVIPFDDKTIIVFNDYIKWYDNSNTVDDKLLKSFNHRIYNYSLFKGNEELIQELYLSLFRIFLSNNHLKLKLYRVCDKDMKEFNYMERCSFIMERLEEFDIIKDYKLDLISLNSLYDFYGKEFDYV